MGLLKFTLAIMLLATSLLKPQPVQGTALRPLPKEESVVIHYPRETVIPPINFPNPSIPNTPSAVERFFRVGLALPYPYFQKPRIRYPVYDKKGKSLASDAYGFGGPETYHATRFSTSEGLY